MNIKLTELHQNLHRFHGQTFQTIQQKQPFTILFHDNVKIRIRLIDRDLSIPISVLLAGIIQLLTQKSFTRKDSIEVLGKDWGYPFVARLLLECDDIVLDSTHGYTKLIRLTKSKNRIPEPEIAAPPPKPHVAVNGNGKVK